MIKKHIFPFSKLKYLKGDRPKVDCILCSSLAKDPNVTSLMVGESKTMGISVNLYPYNTAHLMVFPKRHLTDIREMSDEEALELHVVTKKLLDVLQKEYDAPGFTVGFNLGDNSGASIPHIHQHIIPRYPNELGVIDLVGGAKVIIEDPNETCKKIQDALKGDEMIQVPN